MKVTKSTWPVRSPRWRVRIANRQELQARLHGRRLRFPMALMGKCRKGYKGNIAGRPPVHVRHRALVRDTVPAIVQSQVALDMTSRCLINSAHQRCGLNDTMSIRKKRPTAARAEALLLSMSRSEAYQADFAHSACAGAVPRCVCQSISILRCHQIIQGRSSQAK